MCSSSKKSRNLGLTPYNIIVKTIMEREFSVYQASWILNIHCLERVKFRNWNSTSDSAKNEHGTYRFLLPRHLTSRLCLTELGRKCADNTLKNIDKIETIQPSCYCHNNIDIYICKSIYYAPNFWTIFSKRCSLLKEKKNTSRRLPPYPCQYWNKSRGKDFIKHFLSVLKPHITLKFNFLILKGHCTEHRTHSHTKFSEKWRWIYAGRDVGDASGLGKDSSM